MSVSELITLLSRYPGDIQVMRDDDEGGFMHVCDVEALDYPDWSPKVRDFMASKGLYPQTVVVVF